MKRGWVMAFAVVFLGTVSLGTVSTPAQGSGDKIELSAGYSYMHFGTSPKVNLNGFDVSGQYKLADWLGIVADVTGEYGKVGDVSSRVYTYLFGPQVSWPRRVSPFAHALVGGSHFDGGGFASKGIAWGLGAGVDYRWKPQLSWRVIEIDAIPTHLGGDEEHNTRLLTGIVFRF